MNDTVHQIELSVILPCLNEADTLGTCLHKIRTVFAEQDIRGEIVVADNGSSDASVSIAEEAGARVIHVARKGYGSALMAGIAAARGTYIIMGDADDSYNFLEIPKFIEQLRSGYDLVQGCRLPAGGGQVLPGAMPWSHRWIGNPLFSFLCRSWFRAPIHDVYCGMRGFSRSCYDQLQPRCIGMEFATEMIIRASLEGVRIAEVPIALHQDGRLTHPPHLRTVRDGWRTLRFFLLYSPRWLFLVPGALLVVFGLFCYALALPGLTFKGLVFDAHTLLFGSVALVCGYQALVFAILSKTYATNAGLLPRDPTLSAFYNLFNLERGLLVGTVLFVAGVALTFWTLWLWKQAGFGPLDYARTMRWAIPAATFTVLGAQTIMFGFFTSILGLEKT